MYLDHHFIKNNFLLRLEKLTSKELHSILICKKNSIASSQQYFNSLFPDSSLDWKFLYFLPEKRSVQAQVLGLFNTKYSVMYYILIKCYLASKNLFLLYVLFVNCTTKL